MFPYLLIYHIDEDLFEIEIKALFHTSKNSQKYPKYSLLFNTVNDKASLAIRYFLLH
jgi:hypothetical protein